MFLISVLILCAILAEGTGNLSEGSIKKSLVRKKRLIDYTCEGKPVSIQEYPYVVNILKNGMTECVGVILSPTFILTAAHCIEFPNVTYSVRSGSSYANGGIHHNIIWKMPHPQYHKDLFPNDLALLIISPAIDLVHSYNRKISLYNGYVSPNTYGTVSGWGSIRKPPEKLELPMILRSITVPVISREQCRLAYQHHLEITDRDICTYDSNEKKLCGPGDSGAPLVVEGHLVGIYAWSAGFNGPVGPDVFMNLAHPIYMNWINSNIPNIQHNQRINNYLRNKNFIFHIQD